MVLPHTGVVGGWRARIGVASWGLRRSPGWSLRDLRNAAIAATVATGIAVAAFSGAGASPATENAGGVVGQWDSQAQETAASGQFIANFAMQFQGYPYVYAGNTPAGFDCSGFTQYVILNTLGIDIGHGVEGQMNYGSWVDWGAWQPGDLVYFAGTYRAGISHTGVYIGDGMFIHAENEGTGVVISSVYSDYYSGHYYGAIRLV
jgi:cell wall-associated NlpC family hydrolase